MKGGIVSDSSKAAFPGIVGQEGYGPCTMGGSSAGGGLQFIEHAPGMTLREWYAGLAMQGLISAMRPEMLDQESFISHMLCVADIAFGMADRMLAESEKLKS